MQVILRQDVEKVGLRGEVVDVAAGFARNFLLPRKLAETATPARGVELRFDVPAGETGTLFGSVTATDIAERVWESQRVRIDRRKLELPESIKRIGRYQVPVELFADVTATMRVAVVPQGGELPPQEEIDAIAAAELKADEEAQADAEAAHAEEEAQIAELTAEEEDAAEAEQVPEDAFRRAADAGDGPEAADGVTE